VIRKTVTSRGVLVTAWLFLAVLVFGAIETGQVLLPTRTPDPSDILVSVAAFAGGLAAGWWIQPEVETSPPDDIEQRPRDGYNGN
jgi:VanZ family protein